MCVCKFVPLHILLSNRRNSIGGLSYSCTLISANPFMYALHHKDAYSLFRPGSKQYICLVLFLLAYICHFGVTTLPNSTILLLHFFFALVPVKKAMSQRLSIQSAEQFPYMEIMIKMQLRHVADIENRY
ncbi:hypothetical protein BKA57DRAFT_452239 [Linnemannia elongata]|nr:hypothetical protein BKA57DRAFT_452239 [Linnemannia elongata]